MKCADVADRVKLINQITLGGLGGCGDFGRYRIDLNAA